MLLRCTSSSVKRAAQHLFLQRLRHLVEAIDLRFRRLERHHRLARGARLVEEVLVQSECGVEPGLLRLEGRDHQHDHPRLHRPDHLRRNAHVLEPGGDERGGVLRDGAIERAAIGVDTLGEQHRRRGQLLGLGEVDLFHERSSRGKGVLIRRTQRIGVGAQRVYGPGEIQDLRCRHELSIGSSCPRLPGFERMRPWSRRSR